MDILNGALGAANTLGLAVMPVHGVSRDGATCLCPKGGSCNDKGKHPIEPGWQRNPFPSGADIHEWFTANPAANVGGRTGSISGNIFVVDFDEGGKEAFAPMVRANGGLPETLVTRTGSGGQHYFYRAPEGVRIPNSISKVAPHVDIRGENGYVVLPPSRTNKGDYVVLHTAQVADAPDWLVQHIMALAAAPVRNAPQAEPKRAQGAEDVAKERNMLRIRLGNLRAKRDKAWSPGDAWDQTCFEEACHLVQLANSGWASLTHEAAHELYLEAAPHDDRWDEREKCWRQAVEKVGDRAMDPPAPTASLEAMATTPGHAVGGASPLTAQEITERSGVAGAEVRGSDSAIIAEFCNEALNERFYYTDERGWLGWDGRVWKHAPAVQLEEEFRLWCSRKVGEAAMAGDDEGVKSYSKRLNTGKIESIPKRARGPMLVPLDVFDQHPDLLNVRNGIVNLATGALLEHNSGYRLTKIADVEYRPGATHPDWDSARAAIPPAVSDWMQLRIGQAATGYPTWDDVLPICQGGGENGKSTFLAAVQHALGQYAGTISEKVLMGRPSDHTTDLADLHGLRLAVIEETSQDGVLNIKRLKDTLGAPRMRARRMRENNVEWNPTHSLFLTTNYAPKVSETDHGTWRRLALVRFPYRYVKEGTALIDAKDRRGDMQLRPRLEAGHEGQHQAVLAWIVEGARRWYASGKAVAQQPEEVKADTAAWRAETDRIHGFLEEYVEFDPQAKVTSADLYEQFTVYLNAVGAPPWSETTFLARLREQPLLRDHSVVKRRTSVLTGLSRPGDVYQEFAPGQQTMVWFGMKFRERRQHGNVSNLAAWR